MCIPTEGSESGLSARLGNTHIPHIKRETDTTSSTFHITLFTTSLRWYTTRFSYHYLWYLAISSCIVIGNNLDPLRQRSTLRSSTLTIFFGASQLGPSLIILTASTMTSPSAIASTAYGPHDDHAAMMLLSSSSSLLMTPPASPSTLARRKQATSCLEPPTLKRKHEGDYITLPLRNLSERGIRVLNLQSQSNKRRIKSTCSRRNRRYRPKGPVPMLRVTDFSGVPCMPYHNGVPVISLRPRINIFEVDKEQDHSCAVQEEQDENAPIRPRLATLASAKLESALAIVSSTLDKSAYSSAANLSSPLLPPKSVKTFHQQSCSSGTSLGGSIAVQASPSISTPLPSDAALIAAAAAASCHSGSSNPFLTLSLSNRKLSFGGSSHYNCRNDVVGSFGGSSFQTPTCPTTTSLVKSLEGLCLPSLEDVNSLNKNGVDMTGGTATRTLQQKRPPLTPQQLGNHNNNQHRGAVFTTFDYLATALRLPDVAFSGSGGSM
jgi:hypothetical protein